jgi:hypothetical protein
VSRTRSLGHAGQIFNGCICQWVDAWCADAWALVLHLCGCCRFPPNINLFSAMVGSGTQVLVIALCVFMLSLVGMFYPYNRGAMLSACVVLYALTAGISGGCRRAMYHTAAACAMAYLLRCCQQCAVAAPAAACTRKQLPCGPIGTQMR